MKLDPALFDEDSRAHLAKWLASEPEMETALLFCRRQRELAALWGAVLHEWLEACFGRSDAGVAQVKLAWWGEALAQASDQSAHPLVRAFAGAGGQEVPTPLWIALAQAAQDLAALDALPSDPTGLLHARRALAQALVAVESALWPQSHAGDADAVARSLVLWQWRHHDPGRDPQPGWLPLNLLARHGMRATDAYARLADPAAAALFSDLAGALLEAPAAPRGPALRRARTRLDGLALRRLRERRPTPFPAAGLGVLWQSWRAARGAA